MAIRGTRVISCNHGDSYENISQWVEAHGHCGTNEGGIISGTLTLNEDGTSVTCVIVWEDEAAKAAWKAGLAPFTRNYETVSKIDETV